MILSVTFYCDVHLLCLFLLNLGFGIKFQAQLLIPAHHYRLRDNDKAVENVNRAVIPSHHTDVHFDIA